MEGNLVQAALSSIRAALLDLNQTALWSRSASAALDDTQETWAVLQALEAVHAQMVVDLEGRELPGGLSTKAFLRSALRRTTGQAAADVRVAWNRLPLVREAFTAGEISRAHMEVITRTVEKIPEELRYRELPKLADLGTEFATGNETAVGGTVTVIDAIDEFFARRARQYDSYQLQCLARAILAALKPNDDDGFDPLAYERRQETHARDESGMFHGSFNLDALNGADLAQAIDHFSAPVPKRTETAADGSTVEIVDSRTPAQRRADALGLIARLALGAAAAGTKAGEPPRVVLYTGVDDYHDLHCTNPAHTDPAHAAPASDAAASEPAAPAPARRARDTAEPYDPETTEPETAEPDTTEPETAEPDTTEPELEPVPASSGADGSGSRRRWSRMHGATETNLGAIGPDLMARFTCDAVLQVALMHPTGAILDLGRDTRTITPAQRRALTARDRGCVIPGCTAPASWCQGHHVTYWEQGGLTDLDNLALVCGHHHTVIHLGLWELRFIDGLPWARPTGLVDPQRRWIRNTYHEDLDAARGLGTQMRLNLRSASDPTRRPDPASEGADSPPGPDEAAPPDDVSPPDDPPGTNRSD